MSQELKLSKAATKMLQQIEHLPESDILWLEDMALGIASSLHHITNKIENPPKRKASGCDIIYLGSDLFPSIRNLKMMLESNELTFEQYITQLDSIVESLKGFVDNSYDAMYHTKVRLHMRGLANVIVTHLEAGPVINKFFEIISVEV